MVGAVVRGLGLTPDWEGDLSEISLIVPEREGVDPATREAAGSLLLQEAVQVRLP